MQSTFLISIFLFLSSISADDTNHRWKDQEEVTVWVNKVGPYHNPQETYEYYSLPFCRPEGKKVRHKSNSLGVILEGNDLYDSGLALHFNVPLKQQKICDLQITPRVAKAFMYAVKHHYWYQMYIDELPVWGMVGEYVRSEPQGETAPPNQGLIYTHKEFSIAFNEDRIIEVNLTSENPKPILAGEIYPMTMSVEWKPTTKKFSTRFDRYLDFDFFEHQIHWFSIFNSFMMVVFLCGVVAMILMRTLRNDYARFTSEDDELDVERVVEESGWKQVHGDVFRAPPHLVLYAAFVGSGTQLLLLAFCGILLTLLGSTYDERGTITSTLVFFYSITSFAAGFASAWFYKTNGGDDWKQAMVLTALIFPGVCFVVIILLNFIAIYYASLAALSFFTIGQMLMIWIFISCPLILGGTILGRSIATEKDFPCRIALTRRPIPTGKWYTSPIALSIFSGILPFGSIFIEMYFIFTSFWNYKFYYVYGFMFLVFLILIIVTVCVTIVSTYFLLNAEDYRWHWTAFCSGGSTALYVYLYAIYYFFSKTKMSGVLQTAFYFGYVFILCLGLFLMCGTIAYLGTNLFVRRIYTYIKSD